MMLPRVHGRAPGRPASLAAILPLVLAFGSGMGWGTATVLLARFVLHERLARLQAVGVVAPLAGVALITAG